jgi:hypothetical protein
LAYLELAVQAVVVGLQGVHLGLPPPHHHEHPVNTLGRRRGESQTASSGCRDRKIDSFSNTPKTPYLEVSELLLGPMRRAGPAADDVIQQVLVLPLLLPDRPVLVFLLVAAQG